MPITLITGPANAGKARALLDALRREARHASTSRRPMPILVVPTAADVHAYRRELAERGPALGVSVTLFGGLIERIVDVAVATDPELARPPIGGLARERMLCTIARGGPRPLVGGGGLGRALAAAIGELQLAAIAPAELERAGERELGSIHRRYARRLEALGRLDAELRQRRALDALRRTPALWRGGAVCLYGFDDLTSVELDAIETLGRVVDANVTVSLSYEEGRDAFAGRASAVAELAPIAREHVRLPARAEHYEPGSRAALHGLERRLFEISQPRELRLFELDGEEQPEVLVAERLDPRGAERLDPRGAERLDPGGAVRLLEGGSERAELELVAETVRALLDANVHPSEIAIVHRDPASIAEQLREALDALAVPHAVQPPVAFADTSIGRALLGALSCAAEGQPRCGPAHLRDLLGWLRAPGVLQRPELADELEQRALRAAVRTAAGGRALWESEHWPLRRIERLRAAAERGPLALIDRAERELTLLFSARRRGAAEVLSDRDGEQELALSDGLHALAELRELAELDGALLGGASGVIETLAGVRLRRSAAHDGVSLLDPLALRARRVRALLLCGLQEGTFPAPAGAGRHVLGQRRLRDAGIASPRGAGGRSESVASERYLFYATVSRPTEALFLSWHATRDDGEPSPPSLFLDDVADLFAERLWDQRQRRGAGAFAPSLRGARGEAPLFERERACGGAPIAADRCGTTGDAVLRRAGGGPLLRDERVLALLAERDVWSASSLERWASCPVAWFVERLLSNDALQPDPEPLQRGSLAHAVLLDVHEQLRERTGSARLTAATLPLALRACTDSLAAHVEELPLAASPERR
ncbi:MAG: PD-(D/E)XK nuclease family protein, partial [Solirubrobacteraceae bacterium]